MISSSSQRKVLQAFTSLDSWSMSFPWQSTSNQIENCLWIVQVSWINDCPGSVFGVMTQESSIILDMVSKAEKPMVAAEWVRDSSTSEESETTQLKIIEACRLKIRSLWMPGYKNSLVVWMLTQGRGTRGTGNVIPLVWKTATSESEIPMLEIHKPTWLLETHELSPSAGTAPSPPSASSSLNWVCHELQEKRRDAKLQAKGQSL